MAYFGDSAVQSLLSGAVGSITVKTTLGPDLTIDQPFASGPPSPAATVAGNILKPAIVVADANGNTLFSSAPYGDPGETAWPLVAAGIGLMAVALVYLMAKKRGF